MQGAPSNPSAGGPFSVLHGRDEAPVAAASSGGLLDLTDRGPNVNGYSSGGNSLFPTPPTNGAGAPAAVPQGEHVGARRISTAQPASLPHVSPLTPGPPAPEPSAGPPSGPRAGDQG